MKSGAGKPVLIVAILFKNKGAIGGMAQRFSVLGAEMIRRGHPVELLTTQSLQNEFSLQSSRALYVVDDSADRLPASAWLLLLSIVWRIAIGQYRQVHIAGAGRLSGVIVRLCRLSGTKISCTFASRTLEMASYGRDADKNRWAKFLDSVDQIDVLNPGHDLMRWNSKISISPCSFPSRLVELEKQIPKTKQKLCVFCGALEPNKNPLLAVEIVAQYVANTNDGIKLIVFGKGRLEQQVLVRMAEINAEFDSEIVQIGKSEDLVFAFQQANVFFSLQEIDNYPSQSLMEAMLMGCKVIASDEGDTYLMIPSDEPLNARIDSRNPVDFLPAMTRAFSDMKASDRNAKFIKSNHSIDCFIGYFLAFSDLR